MPVFVLFVFGAVILGGGAMLSPAWPTAQPRVGLGAAFALAIITGGAVFLASLFGWDTLLIDYLLFALVVGIFLGGTLAVGQQRAEKHGKTLTDADQGWPGPEDLALFMIVGSLFALVVLLRPLPYGDRGAAYGLLGLSVRDGGTFDTLTPLYPDVSYLHAPGFSAVTAYLSRQLGESIPTVQFSVAAVIALINVWAAYDFGAELSSKRLGRAMALTMFLSLGVLGGLLDGHYAALMALLFAQAFVIFALRFARHGLPVDAVGAGLMLGAVLIAQIDFFVIVLLGYLPWLGLIFFSETRPSRRAWIVLSAVIPLIALAATSPWLLNAPFDLAPDPLARAVDHIEVMTAYHGWWIIPAAIAGAWIGWQRRDAAAVLAIGWLIVLFDFAVTGGVTGLLPFLARLADPNLAARFGVVIPFTLLGGMGLLWAWDVVLARTIDPLWARLPIPARISAFVLAGIVAALLLPLAFLGVETVEAKRETPTTQWTPAAADRQMMTWLMENTPQETSRVLNYPDAPDGLWVAAQAEREAIYFPALPGMRVPEARQQEQEALRAFWESPLTTFDLLSQAGIDYLIVPAYFFPNPIGAEVNFRLETENEGAAVFSVAQVE